MRTSAVTSQCRGRLAARLGRAAAVVLIAAPLGVGIAELFGTGNAMLYAVLMASSSAALILPIVDSLHLAGPGVLELPA